MIACTGVADARQWVPANVVEHEVMVVALATTEILSTRLIEPGRPHGRTQRPDPGR